MFTGFSAGPERDEFDDEEGGAVVFVEDGLISTTSKENHGLGLSAIISMVRPEIKGSREVTPPRTGVPTRERRRDDEVHIEADGDGGVVHGRYLRASE